MQTERLTLGTIATAAVMAASIGATWIPAWLTPGPLLTWAAIYLGCVLGLARVLNLPPARTLLATTLLVTAALQITLTALLHVLTQLNAAGLTMLATASPQEA